MTPPKETKQELDKNPLVQALGPSPVLYEINLRKISDPLQTDVDKLNLLKEPMVQNPQKKDARLEDVEVDVFKAYSRSSPVPKGAKQ